VIRNTHLRCIALKIKVESLRQICRLIYGTTAVKLLVQLMNMVPLQALPYYLYTVKTGRTSNTSRCGLWVSELIALRGAIRIEGCPDNRPPDTCPSISAPDKQQTLHCVLRTVISLIVQEHVRNSGDIHVEMLLFLALCIVLYVTENTAEILIHSNLMVVCF